MFPNFAQNLEILKEIWSIDSQKKPYIYCNQTSVLRLKYTKFNFGWGSAPGPAGRAYSAPPGFLAGFKGPSAKAREGVGYRRVEGERGGDGTEEEGTPKGWFTLPCPKS